LLGREGIGRLAHYSLIAGMSVVCLGIGLFAIFVLDRSTQKNLKSFEAKGERDVWPFYRRGDFEQAVEQYGRQERQETLPGSMTARRID
jgi:hypothetical protein